MQSEVCPADNMGNDHYANGDHIVTMDHMGRSVAILAQGQLAATLSFGKFMGLLVTVTTVSRILASIAAGHWAPIIGTSDLASCAAKSCDTVARLEDRRQDDSSRPQFWYNLGALLLLLGIVFIFGLLRDRSGASPTAETAAFVNCFSAWPGSGSFF